MYHGVALLLDDNYFSLEATAPRDSTVANRSAY
jgi:hypothetical protein